jgi:hypothetical protein
MAASVSALWANSTLPPGFFIFKDSSYSFLLEAESTPAPEGLGKFEKKKKKFTSSGCDPATFRLAA